MSKNMQVLESKSALMHLKDLNPKFFERLEKLNNENKVILLRTYETPDRDEELLIEAILMELDNKVYNNSNEERVRQEMMLYESSGGSFDEPEEELRWEMALQEARAKDQEMEIARKSENKFMQNGNVNILPNDISLKKGLGEKSIFKLRAANINTIQQFDEMSYEQKVSVLGSIVAHKYKPQDANL